LLSEKNALRAAVADGGQAPCDLLAPPRHLEEMARTSKTARADMGRVVCGEGGGSECRVMSGLGR